MYGNGLRNDKNRENSPNLFASRVHVPFAIEQTTTKRTRLQGGETPLAYHLAVPDSFSL